jgi:uncharacterized membrane protein YjjP (DUF1212 family)
MKTRIGHNIFKEGNKIYSFLTHVATIEGDKLIEHGKYSKTTSKHVSKVADMYGLELVRSKDKVTDFNMLPVGIILR